jgi:plastocyanin
MIIANMRPRAAFISLGQALMTFAAVVTIADVVPGHSHAQAASITVPIKNFAYMPMSVTVSVGSSVIWNNLDGEPHTVTSLDGLFRSGALDQDDSFTFKFDKPGVYKYVCSIHPNMRAEIIVK